MRHSIIIEKWKAASGWLVRPYVTFQSQETKKKNVDEKTSIRRDQAMFCSDSSDTGIHVDVTTAYATPSKHQ